MLAMLDLHTITALAYPKRQPAGTGVAKAT